jgi:hypothetical protein
MPSVRFILEAVYFYSRRVSPNILVGLSDRRLSEINPWRPQSRILTKFAIVRLRSGLTGIVYQGC